MVTNLLQRPNFTVDFVAYRSTFVADCSTQFPALKEGIEEDSGRFSLFFRFVCADARPENE